VKIRFAFALALLCAGCTTQPKMLWMRADGQRITGNPALSQQVELDETVCAGEASKADMSGTVIDRGGIAGAVNDVRRGQESLSVTRGCMAQRGYVLIPADQADERLTEAAAVHAAPKAKATAGR
jgi:hypothetical protein